MTLRFEIDRTLFPFESRFVALPSGGQVHYVDEGAGPTLLLLHGNPTWSFLYRSIIAGLRDRFRCVAPDYPGFGLSEPPPGYRYTAAEHAAVLTEFVDRLDLEGVTMMGQDWGGPIGFAAALDRPGRFARFVIGNTWAWPVERPGHKVFSAVMGGPIGRAAASAFNGVLRAFFAFGVTRPLPAEVLRMYHAPFAERRRRAPTAIFPREIRAASAMLRRVADGLPSLSDRPALILWGDRDFAFRTPERERFRGTFVTARDVTLHNAGHFIQEDAPGRIVGEIRAWIPDA